jgi:hypothetical protein
MAMFDVSGETGVALPECWRHSRGVSSITRNLLPLRDLQQAIPGGHGLSDWPRIRRSGRVSPCRIAERPGRSHGVAYEARFMLCSRLATVEDRDVLGLWRRVACRSGWRGQACNGKGRRLQVIELTLFGTCDEGFPLRVGEEEDGSGTFIFGITNGDAARARPRHLYAIAVEIAERTLVPCCITKIRRGGCTRMTERFAVQRCKPLHRTPSSRKAPGRTFSADRSLKQSVGAGILGRNAGASGYLVREVMILAGCGP